MLSCAHSRVPVELIFDQSIGHLFVTRVAGNIATSAIIASLEYGIAVLGTKAIMVLGHANCGAVKAAIEAKGFPGRSARSTLTSARPSIRPGGDLEAAIKANAEIQAGAAAAILTGSGRAIKQKPLKIVAGYYDLATGKVISWIELPA